MKFNWLIFKFLVLINLSQLVLSSTVLCKCDCELNYQIFELNKLFENEPNLCSKCTVEMCNNQNIQFCSKDNEKKIMTSDCFTRESNKDSIIIYSFILIIIGLIINVVINEIRSRISSRF